MNNLILRRYAIKPIGKVERTADGIEKNQSLKTLAQPLPDTAGKPIHKLVHNAMLSVVNDLGLLTPDLHPKRQYHEFAQYRDMANQELGNPDSPFTKMLNRHKAELHKVPNPHEHLKKALLPMFQYLTKQGEGTPTHDVGGESEPIDLLHSGYSPYELVDESDKGFHYEPRLPSGFVQVPPPQPKRKASPQRHDIYKSIAEHADMGWSAPDNLKEYLVKKHGISPQEASVHIGNFRRRQKKPAAPKPVETKRVWPPIQRKSRVDSTDLLEIPELVKYAKSGNIGKPIQVQAKGEPYIATRNSQGYGIVPAGNSINRISRSYQVFCDEDGNPRSCSCPDHVYRNRVCKHMQAVAGIPKGENEEETDDKPVQLSAYRAPKHGVIVRGTQYTGGQMIPDMESKFMNPRRKIFSKIK